MENNWEVFKKIVDARRSVRVYLPEAVPEQVVRRALDAALLAPTSSNLQCWEFHWVRSAEKKKKIVEACLSQPAAKTAPELIVAVARTRTWDANRKRMLEHLADAAKQSGKATPQGLVDYYQKLVPLVYGQGFFGILGLMKRALLPLVSLFRPVPQEPVSAAQMRTWAVKTSALACENFMLAASAQGYDTCPMEGFDSRWVKAALDLPSDAVVTMVISLGKRAPEGIYGPRVRFDSKHFILER